MATTPKTTVGTMACLCCGQEIPVKQAENGTINAACNWCDFPAYAKKGTQAHSIIMGRLKNQPKQAATQAQQAQPATKTIAKQMVTVPEVKKHRNSIFDLGGDDK